MRFLWNAAGTALYVEAVLNEVQNVWRVRVDPMTLEWLTAERLTTGMGPDVAAPTCLCPESRPLLCAGSIGPERIVGGWSKTGNISMLDNVDK